MKSEHKEIIMQSNSWRLVADLASLLTCTTGCQFPGFRDSRDAVQNVSSGGDVERLSDRQVADVQLSLARSLEQQREYSRALDAYRGVAEKDSQRATAY